MLAMVFFLYLGDAVISDWLPVYLQGALSGSLLMGLMISFSSLAGMGADLIFPQLLKSISSRKMIVMAIFCVFLTAGILILTTHWVWPVLLLLAMGTWGVYYEFLGFGLLHFVARNAPLTTRSGVWSVDTVFKSVAYFLGPLIGSWLYLSRGNYYVIGIYVLFASVAYLIWKVVGFKQGDEGVMEEFETDKVNLLAEIKCWIVLFEHVWPILVVSLTLGLVDAAFWTTGVVLSISLIESNLWGSLFIPAYEFPSIFLGFLIAKMGIYQGKKRLAILYMILTGLFTIGLGLDGGPVIMVLLALAIGVVTSIAWPMVDAVYSDICARMGKEERHMMGLSSSTVNLSYITGPVAAGFLASRIGEAKTMMWIGVFVALVAVTLLFVTPLKLRLPQKEIKSWE